MRKISSVLLTVLLAAQFAKSQNSYSPVAVCPVSIDYLNQNGKLFGNSSSSRIS